MRSILFVSMACWLLSSCASTRAEPLPLPVKLPSREEPVHERISYASLPAGQHMIVTLDTDGILGEIKHRFSDQIVAGRSNIQLVSEALVMANGVPYRRVWVEYTDEGTLTMHGSCFQEVAVWLNQTGAVAEVFVSEMSCPI